METVAIGCSSEGGSWRGFGEAASLELGAQRGKHAVETAVDPERIRVAENPRDLSHREIVLEPQRDQKLIFRSQVGQCGLQCRPYLGGL